jgi:SHAQKYF class myb-like DNA-binding protein
MDTSVDEILKENQDLICKIISEQNTLPYTPDVKKMKDLYSNILKLSAIADKLPDTPNLLFQHYIPLSSSDKARINYYERIQEANAGEHRRPSPPKKSRAECRWKPEEEEKFRAALQKYGEKDLKSIANYIGTRTKIQVRSHLQKFKLKQASSTPNNN